MRLWIAAAVVLGLAALGLATAPHVIDWEAYRGDIEAAASQRSGHQVTINGPIAFSLLPRPMLTASDVVVEAAAEEAIGFTLAIRQAELIMEIGPLLAGRPALRDLRLQRPVVRVDGESSRKLRSWPPRWEDWIVPFARLDLDTVSIAGGRVELIGDRPDRRVGLSDLSLELRIDGPGGPLDARGLFKTKRHRFAMNAAFGRPDSDGFRASRLSIDARNGIDEMTTLRFKGRIRADDQEPRLDGRLTLTGPDLRHGLAAIAAAAGSPSTFRSIGGAQPFAVEGRIEADRSGIRSDALTLELSERLGKGRIALTLHPRRQLDLEVELPALRLASEIGVDDLLPLDLLAGLDIPPGRIAIDLRELLYRDGAARQASIRLQTAGNGITRVERAKVQLPGLIDLRFQGRRAPGKTGPRLEGKLAAVGDDLKSSLVWLNLIDDEDRSEGWRRFSLESDLEISAVEMALTALDLRLDRSRLGGRASVGFGERRRLSLDIDVARLDLDLYLPDGPAGTPARLAELFRTIDADVRAGFERLVWQGVHVERGRISASVDDGRVALKDIAATTVGDTSLSLEGLIDLGRGSAELEGGLESAHPARALHHLDLDLPLSTGRLQPVALSAGISGTLDRFAIRLDADYDRGGVVIDGRAGWIDDRPWYDLDVDARHPDHQALASQLGLAPLVAAGDAEGPLELAVRLRRQSAEPWTLSGSAKLGPTTFTGSLAHGKDAGSGPFEARLSVGTPRKDSLAPLLILGGLRLAGGWTPDRWLGRLPGTGLRTAWLDTADGTLELISKGGLAGDGVALRAKLADGLLYVDLHDASPWQGRMKAELSLERRRDRPLVALAVELDQVEAAQLAAWLGVKSGIAGPLDLKLEASATGRNPFDLVAGLAGAVEIEAGPGEIKGLGIPELRQTVLPGAGDRGPADRSLSLPFGAIEANGVLDRGILTFDDARITLEPPSGGGEEIAIDGRIDLLLWIADLTLSAPDSATDQIFRVVGSPSRPQGYRLSGKR